MDRPIRAGDGIVCRVNGTFDSVISTVVAGKAGALSWRAVSTMVGEDSAVRQAYQQRMHDSRVWLFEGAAAAYSRLPRQRIEGRVPPTRAGCEAYGTVSVEHARRGRSQQRL